jgi:hypothetical protein
VWNVHINSKKHHENITSAKRKREDTVHFVHPSVPELVKGPAQTDVTTPPKKLIQRRIRLKNAHSRAMPYAYIVYICGKH